MNSQYISLFMAEVMFQVTEIIARAILLMVNYNFVRLSAILHAFLFHTSSLFQRSFGTAWYCTVKPLALYKLLMFPLLTNQKLHYFIL